MNFFQIWVLFILFKLLFFIIDFVFFRFLLFLSCFLMVILLEVNSCVNRKDFYFCNDDSYFCYGLLTLIVKGSNLALVNALLSSLCFLLILLFSTILTFSLLRLICSFLHAILLLIITKVHLK